MQPNATPKTKALRAVKRSWHDLRHSAQNMGLLPAHSDYTRFLILASARTGSTLLTRSLNRHSAILAYGEILRDSHFFPARFAEFGHSQTIYQNDPVRFIETKVYRKYPPEVKAAGFKIFYRHAPRETAWGQAVWQHLAGQETIKIIHLKRRNLLKAQLSRQKAAGTREWIKYSAAHQDGAVTLAYEEALSRFTQTRQWEDEYAALFAGHPLIEVYYEELVADYAGQMARLQTFLGVTPQAIRPPTQKRTAQSLSSQIANYHELKSQFAGSPWAVFFDE